MPPLRPPTVADLILDIWFQKTLRDSRGFWTLVDVRDPWTRFVHMWNNVAVYYRRDGFN